MLRDRCQFVLRESICPQSQNNSSTFLYLCYTHKLPKKSY